MPPAPTRSTDGDVVEKIASLLMGAISLGYLFYLLYRTDSNFKYAVDRQKEQVLYRLEEARWTEKLSKLAGWQRELINHSHPLPEAHKVEFTSKTRSFWLRVLSHS